MTRNAPPRQAAPVTTICIVDPHSVGYQSWGEATDLQDVRVEIVPSAEAALRLAQTMAIDLWVIDVDLPGLSGIELCSMLKARSNRTLVCLVSEHFSAEDERAAWAARPTLIACKPGHFDWLSACVAHKRSLRSRVACAPTGAGE